MKKEKPNKLMPKGEFLQAHSELLESLDLKEGVVPHLEKEMEFRDSLLEGGINKRLKKLKK